MADAALVARTPCRLTVCCTRVLWWTSHDWFVDAMGSLTNRMSRPPIFEGTITNSVSDLVPRRPFFSRKSRAVGRAVTARTSP